MYHSITFIDASSGTSKNCWTDWGLVPDSRPVISPPEAITKIVEVEGSSRGFIDLTDKATGVPMFKSRTGSFNFIITRNDIATPTTAYESWHTTYNIISTFLHNQKVKIVLEDDPSWYYIGRTAVSSFATNKDYSKIQINYTVEPYKYRTNFDESDILDWEWDPTDLEDPWAAIQDMKDIEIVHPTSGSTVATLQFDWIGMPCRPKFLLKNSSTSTGTTNKRFTISHTVELPNGSSDTGVINLYAPIPNSNKYFYNRNIIFRPGTNTLSFTRYADSSDETDTSTWYINVAVTEGRL